MNGRRRSRRRRLFITLLSLFLVASFGVYQFAGPLLGHARLGDCSVLVDGEIKYLNVADTQVLVADAIGGKRDLGRAAISCSYSPIDRTDSQSILDSGLTQRAEEMRARIKNTFGKIAYGGYAPGGVDSGHIPGSAHYEGRAIDYFFRPFDNPDKKQAGWRLAQWAVVHADELSINTIIYDDKIWTRQSSWLGWREYTHPSGKTDNPILRHLDHVHLDVN